jgi:hypothetical protein
MSASAPLLEVSGPVMLALSFVESDHLGNTVCIAAAETKLLGGTTMGTTADFRMR